MSSSRMIPLAFIALSLENDLKCYCLNVRIDSGDDVARFVRFIRGGSWLLAVFRRAFSYRQRWGLDMAQWAIPL